MGKYLKIFLTTASYLEALSNLILPNVSVCEDDLEKIYYNPYVAPLTPVETRLVVKYNVTSTQEPIQLFYSDGSGSGSGSGSGGEPPFSAMEIDGVEQSEVVNEYTFDTVGEHTVKYTLTNPTSIGSGAFQGCSGLTSVTIPNSVTSISDYAFIRCSSLTSIGSVGSGASLEIPDSVTSIGSDAFQICSGLTSIVIPNSVTTIGDTVFSSCSGLTSVTIGSGVTSIGDYVFSYCDGLTSVTIEATTPPLSGSHLFWPVSGPPIYVPSGSVEAYKTASGWSQYASRIQAIP